MPSPVSATFEVKDWVETSLDEVEMPKVTRAVVAKTYSGDIDGTSTTEWLMSYAEDGSATFVGMERISGSVGGRDGSFVVKHDGKYEGGAAVGSLTVVRGSGTDALTFAANEVACLSALMRTSVSGTTSEYRASKMMPSPAPKKPP